MSHGIHQNDLSYLVILLKYNENEVYIYNRNQKELLKVYNTSIQIN